MGNQDDTRSAFLRSTTNLAVGDAVAAIILLEDGRYLLQLRDEMESIWYPGHWGCFGGGVDPGEGVIDALHRELREELSYEIREAQFFYDFQFDLGGLQLGQYYRRYYLVRMTLEEMTCLKLAEGAAVQAFDSDTILDSLKLSPYDAFALFLHAHAFRIGEFK